MAGVATTFPASGSDTAINRFEHTEKRRRLLVSIASPEGSWQGLSEYFFVIVAFAASTSTISLVSSMLA